MNNSDITFIVNRIRNRYKSFFDDKNLYHLFYYLLGYLNSRLYNDSLSDIDNYFLQRFSKWVCEKYENPEIISWVDVIYKVNNDDESRIVDFFSCFDEFLTTYNNPASSDFESEI
jgi:hypothetical protein